MAARRLLIVMLILLGISSVIAMIVPEPNRKDSAPEEKPADGGTGETGTAGVAGETGETGVTGNTGATGTTGDEPGEVRQASVVLGESKPTTVKEEPGTRLILTVESKQASEVEIEGLGLTGFADQFAPAVFDLILPEEPGRYKVRVPGEKPSAFIVTT